MGAAMAQEMLIDILLGAVRRAHGGVPIYEILALANGLPASIRRLKPELFSHETVSFQRGVHETVEDFCDRLVNKPIKPIRPNK